MKQRLELGVALLVPIQPHHHRVVALVLGLVCGFASPALAQDYQRRIDDYQAAATEFSTKEAKGQAALELGTLREWIGEARAYLREDDEDALKRTLDRARVQSRLVDALIRRATAEAEARTAHEAADAKENEAGSLRNEAQALEQKLAALEQSAQQPQEAPK